MAARQNQAFDYLLKLIIIGDSGVGKTCILLNYVGDSFQAPHISTIGKSKLFKTHQHKYLIAYTDYRN